MDKNMEVMLNIFEEDERSLEVQQIKNAKSPLIEQEEKMAHRIAKRLNLHEHEKGFTFDQESTVL